MVSSRQEAQDWLAGLKRRYDGKKDLISCVLEGRALYYSSFAIKKAGKAGSRGQYISNAIIQYEERIMSRYGELEDTRRINRDLLVENSELKKNIQSLQKLLQEN